MGIKKHIAKKAAKFVFHEICDNYARGNRHSYSSDYVSNSIDMNTLDEALSHAEQVCCSINPTCKKEHLALFKAEVINYIHTK